MMSLSHMRVVMMGLALLVFTFGLANAGGMEKSMRKDEMKSGTMMEKPMKKDEMKSKKME